MPLSSQTSTNPPHKLPTFHLPSRQDQSGVLLLEVLISILIFSFAFLGLVALQARSVQFSVEAEDRNRAALMANEMVTTMWTQQTTAAGDLSSQITNWKAKVQDPSKSGLPNANATVGAPDANGVVMVTVSWTPAGDSSSPRSYNTQVIMP